MKQLIIDRNSPQGRFEDISQTAAFLPSYEERVITRIRAKYRVDDELAILRQRDTKPEEFAAYFAFVEQIKNEERLRGDSDVVV